MKYQSIEGYPGYRVGNDGSVWSRWKGGRHGMGIKWKQLRPVRNSQSGRSQIELSCDGASKIFYVHRLVLIAFVGPPPDGMECCHIDGDPTNNNLRNLRWGTRESNCADKIRHGTHSRGERSGNAKLTAEKVSEIRSKYAAGGVTYRELAQQYGVHHTGIYRVIQRKGWF